jgi:Tfp pilus assembly protein PilV
MLAIVAAVLFGLALIFDLAGVSVEVLTSQFLVTAGLLCLALYLAGIGSRTVSARRSRR